MSKDSTCRSRLAEMTDRHTAKKEVENACENAGEESPRQKAYSWGREGERIAQDFIASQGFPITHANWRCGNTLEIDIISQQGEEMVFVEVKTRNGRYKDPEEAIDEKKMRQLVKAANAYLQTLERDFSARFDVVLIEGSPKEYEITYLRDAFIPPLSR